MEIKEGSKVRIKVKGNFYEGIVMPKTKQSKENVLVIKLQNGYNVGFDTDDIEDIEILQESHKIAYLPKEIEFSKVEGRKSISIIGCGGTIASRVEYRTGAVIAAFSPDDLILSFPELREIANIDGRKIFDLMSEDMTSHHWKIIAEEVYKEIKKDVDAVILTHGTDTMHFTSAALSFALQNLSIPIILVGAQRSSDRPSSDNYLNLLSASYFAVNSNVSEVLVCMHGATNDDYCYLHRGTRVRKMHTSRRDAFKSINSLPLAKVDYFEKKIEYLLDNYKTVDKSRKVELINDFNENVGLIYVFPNIKPEFISSLSKFFDGIVLAVTGLGHVPVNYNKNPFTKSILNEIKNLIDSNIPVVVAPQTFYGRLNLKVYAPGRLLLETNIIGDDMDWLPEVAFVKLSWALAQTKDMKRIREIMYTNYANEFSLTTDVRNFYY
ncbi:MAG: Glu-tRNA(Gln) amidotransferase subunit GatD [Candidatus Aenigmarchaeota archaeon]|nr:Glu-tRNA(Gln) amidotransferase subunit GatD [Candidatus Aenigmarchaeota archaeon]MDW8149145.1 Glu-tRNA(Gln) amidotransferase subunit GatD [Candidatus Aenigmarchaeota archaeon]